MPQHLEAGRQVFELLADLLTDTATQLTAAGTELFGFAQVVLDLDPRQVVRQRIAAMLMFLLHTPRDDFLTGLFSELGFIERQLINPLAEEEQLSWIERFVLGP